MLMVLNLSYPGSSNQQIYVSNEILRLGAVCVYDHLSELELLRTHHSFSYTLTREPSKYTPLYPIEFQDHIPMLLRFCTYHPQPFAMRD
jgi:hypothetical protein